jgi:hypothetical protein
MYLLKRIRLQELARLDMIRSANGRLQELDNVEQISCLVSQIVNRSDGIFLWVPFVVKLFPRISRMIRISWPSILFSNRSQLSLRYCLNDSLQLCTSLREKEHTVCMT